MTTLSSDQTLLTVREVADVMRVSTMTVYRLIKAGDLDALRVGAHLRIHRSALRDYVQSHRVATLDAPLRH